MRKNMSTVIAILIVCFSAVNSFGYGYAEKEDPMVGLFKQAVAAAKKGNWTAVKANIDKGIAQRKGEMFEAEHLKPRFDKAIEAKDISVMAETFANLVYLSIREKLHATTKDKFSNYKNAKKRLQLARKSYMDVLDGNVKKKNPSRSKQILGSFNTALKALGNPGVFGVGKKAPDPEAYKKQVSRIEGLIEKSFPSFSK